MEPQIVQQHGPSGASPMDIQSSNPVGKSMPAPGFLLKASRSTPIQAAGLGELAKPKVETIPIQEFTLQTNIMSELSGMIESGKLGPPQNVYRIGTVELLRNEKGDLSPEFHPPGTDLVIPDGLIDGTALTAGNKDLQGKINDNVMSTLRGAGQMDYIQEKEMVNADWRILIDVDFYYERPKDAIGFHKDTIGRSLFVNLSFNNEEPTMGPEYILNPEVYQEHEELLKDKLPPAFLADLTAQRGTLGDPKEISATTIQKHGRISFVDELIHHTTPNHAHRGLTPAEITDFADQIRTAHRMTTLLEGTHFAKGNDRKFMESYVGLNQRQLNFLFPPGQPQMLSTGQIKEKLKGNTEYEMMVKIRKYRFQEPLLRKFAETDQPSVTYDEMAAAGLSQDLITELSTGFPRNDLRTVNIAHCEDTCDKDINKKPAQFPPPGAPKLKRQMSRLLNGSEPGYIPPNEKKRQFFRTWVQSKRRDKPTLQTTEAMQED